MIALYDTGDPGRDALLSLLAGIIIFMALLSFLPWRRWRPLTWMAHLPLVAFAAYAWLEWLMPNRYDIRVDLLVLWPLLGLIALVWVGKLLWRARPRNRERS